MSRVLFLDSGPLGLISHPQRSPEVIGVTEWLERHLRSGSRVVVPAIVYYEIRREFLRANKTLSLSRLDQFIGVTPSRYLPLSDAALRLAAELWAKARQQGRPTAEFKALEIDVIIAAQVLSYGANSDVVIATTNSRHLAHFVPAKNWNAILPDE